MTINYHDDQINKIKRKLICAASIARIVDTYIWNYCLCSFSFIFLPAHSSCVVCHALLFLLFCPGFCFRALSLRFDSCMVFFFTSLISFPYTISAINNFDAVECIHIHSYDLHSERNS